MLFCFSPKTFFSTCVDFSIFKTADRHLFLLVPLENPVADDDDYRIEVLISLRRLERLDKDGYTEDERQEAEEVYPVFSKKFPVSLYSTPS